MRDHQWMNALRGGEATTRRRDNPPKDKVNSPAPTNLYTPTELGPDDMDYFEPGGDDVPDGDDPGDGGDGNGGNGGGGPPSPPDPYDKPEGDKNRRVPRRNRDGPNPPGGGDDGNDDPDDEKFRRRMIKFLGGYVIKDMRTNPKSRRLTPSRSQHSHWRKPIVIGESRPEKQL